jgi:pyruvate-formate lyase-activating enzyme
MQDLKFGIHYPAADRFLYSNIKYIEGWCFHPVDPIQSIRLYIDGKMISEAVTGFCRTDVMKKYQENKHASLYSGFKCYFNHSDYQDGEIKLDFCISTCKADYIRSKIIKKKRDDETLRIRYIFIDIIGQCNLKCKMCPQGDSYGEKGERDKGIMSSEVFNNLIQHLKSENVLIDKIHPYNWGESLLHPEIDEILKICKDQNLSAIFSSNLAFPSKFLEPVLSHGLDAISITISGFSDDIYKKNHGGDLEQVLRNFEIVRENRDRIKDVYLKYLVFKYNIDDIKRARDFAKSNSFKFLLFKGAINNVEAYFKYLDNPVYSRIVEEMIFLENIQLQPTKFCFEEEVITINHKGELELCCCIWNQKPIISAFKADFADYLNNKLKNEFCKKCLRSGYSHYRHNTFIPDIVF